MIIFIKEAERERERESIGKTSKEKKMDEKNRY